MINELEELFEKINKDEYLHAEVLDFPIISIYATKEYDFNDYEIISKAQRDHLHNKVNKSDFLWKTGSTLFSKEHSLTIVFPKFKNREFLPYKEIDKLDKNSTIIVLTPTQLLYHYIKNEVSLEKCIDLVYEQPANLKKLKRIIPDYKNILEQIEVEQESAIKISPLIYKTDIDTTF